MHAKLTFWGQDPAFRNAFLIGFLFFLVSILYPESAAAIANVGGIKITSTPPVYNAAEQTYESLVTLTNTSKKKSIQGPLALLISANAKKGITLANPSGFVKNKGYLHIPLPSGVLAPQQTIGNIVVAFHNPAGKEFNFSKKVITGLAESLPTPPNHSPVAKIEHNQIVALDSPIDLNGSASSDPEGQALTYQWTLLQKPQNSNAALSEADQPHCRITIDINGHYKIQLIVNDGQVNSFPAVIELDTENSPPLAMLASKLKAQQGDRIDLDGSGSFDRDGDSLNYSWSLPVKPGGSKAKLPPDNQPHSLLAIDKKGSYTARLVVNDGRQNSVPATVTVTTNNALPVANAGNDLVDQLLNQALTLSGELSSDADNAPLSYKWSLLHKPANSSALLSPVDQQKSALTPDVDGRYIAQLIVNDGFNNSAPDTVEITASGAVPVNHSPTITSQPQTLVVISGQRFDYSVVATDQDNDTLNYSLLQSPPGMTINAASGEVDWGTSAEQTGEFLISINVADGHGGSTTQTFTLVVNAALAVVPDVSGKSLSEALALLKNAGLKEGTAVYDHSDSIPNGNVISQSIAAGSQATFNSPIDLHVSLGPQGNTLPPDPANIAPAVDPTTTTTVASAAAFLYGGDHPIQTDVDAQAIEAKRAAVLRGKILDLQNQPLSGVTVSVHDHPEFGKTLSRADGQFDMVVNGGGALTIDYAKSGLLPVQRQIDVPWQDYIIAPDVVLKAVDAEVTTVAAAAGQMQVASGSVQTDSDGSRRATLLFPAGTTATMTLPDGSSQALTNFHVRATEYTVGDNGPQAMPGELPPTSGYTYAAEFSVDEALAAGATDVVFNQPIISYNENFLGFPVGATVPSGYYDRKQGKWKPQASGRIVKIAAITDGIADLIIDDSDAAASETELTAIGITQAERQRLATLYQAGQTLWRVELNHFSPWDYNWARRLPPGARSPSEKKPSTKTKPDSSCELPGCIIGAQGQTLSEEYPIVGTPYFLRYDSDRQSGYVESHTMTIPLISEQLPPLKRIDLTVRIAGQQHVSSFPAQANQTTQFTWDGKDVYGRSLQGQQIAFTDLGYVYDATVQQTITFAESGPGVQLTGDKARNEVTLHQTQSAVLGNFKAVNLNLGGWTFNVHHYYDPISRVLYQGDGARRSVQGVANIITTAATTGFGDLGYSLAVGADGSLYYADRARIHKIDPQGIRSVVAGTGESGYSGDGGPAVNAQISFCAQYVNIANDGSIIFFEGNCFGLNRIRKIDPNGIITTLAGTGNGGYATPDPAGIPGNEFPLISAIPRPAPDGSVYIADQGRLWKLGTDGRVREVNIDYSAEDAGPGNLKIADFAVGADGSLYIMDTGLVASNFLIRKLTPDGKMHLLAGTNQRDSNRDGGPALTADIWPNTNGGIAVSPSGDVYFSEGDSVIRKISTDGIISQFAGNRVLDYTGDGGPAPQASIRFANALAFGPDGALYMADGHIRRVGPTLPGYDANNLSVPSEDGSELFIFDASGKHLKTVNTLTGATVTEFSYDSGGRLIRVTDGDNNVTTIERDNFGNPTGIVSPYNQRTELAVNGNGYFSSITNPANETDSFTYSNNGLLLSKKDPGNNLTAFAYDTLGRLLSDTNALNNQQTLAKSGTDNDYTVEHQSALGRKTDYRVQIANDGGLTSTVTAADGTQTQSTEGANGINQYSDAEGTTNSETLTGDPRWNMQSPYAKSAALSTGGFTANVTNSITATLTDPSNLLSLSTLTQTSSINNRSYLSQYTATNKTLTETSPAGRIAKTQIDNQGRPVSIQITGLFDTQASYDSRGRLSTIASGADPDQRSTSIGYNTAGYVSSITDALGRVEAFEYDAAGRVIRQTLTDGREVLYGYDSRGNLTSITPPGRPKHDFAYDALSQNDEYNPPEVGNGGGTQYAYNQDKQLSQITRPDNQTLSLVYDTAGRLATLKTPLGDYGYDYHPTTGQLIQQTSPTGGKLDFGYSGALLTGVTFSGEVAGSVGYGYDNDFRISEISVNAANPVSYGYDNDSLLTQVGDLQFSRDSQNGLLTGSTLGVVTDNRSFNGFAETTQYQAKINGDNAYKAEYSYDKLGRIVQKIETIADDAPVTHAYGYDAAGRLSSVKIGAAETTYGYDSNGNRTTINGATVGSYDDQDRLSNYNGASYAYTANGELKSKTEGGGTTHYQYDVLGNLRQVSFANGDKIDYAIDALDRRVGRKAVIGGVATEQRFLYQDDLKIVAELDGSNNVVSRFVYGTRVNVPDYMIKDGNTYRLVTDHLGSPRVVIDTATGAIAQRIEYDAWGKVLSDSNPGFQPFGFAGGLYDRQTGLVRFGARDYETETGRWTIKDPILFSGGDNNLFGYVFADPINIIDQDGMKPPFGVGVGINLNASIDLNKSFDQIKDSVKDIYNEFFKKKPEPNPEKKAPTNTNNSPACKKKTPPPTQKSKKPQSNPKKPSSYPKPITPSSSPNGPVFNGNFTGNYTNNTYYGNNSGNSSSNSTTFTPYRYND